MDEPGESVGVYRSLSSLGSLSSLSESIELEPTRLDRLDRLDSLDRLIPVQGITVSFAYVYAFKS